MMKLGLTVLTLCLSYASADLFHASCSVKWTLSESCDNVQTMIVNQMNLWDNEDCGTKPGDDAPHGQKCLYHHDRDVELTTYGTHTTPIHRYVDNLTMSVHNFLAELHATSGASKKFSSAGHLKEDVCDLYKLWDQAHHNTVGNITRTEDLLAKLRMFETEVVQLQTLLNQDKRKIRHRYRTGSTWSADSGISDDSGEWVTDSDERLAKLKLIADSLRRNLPADSPSLQIIDRTLQSTSDQLEDLHRSYDKIVTKSKPKLKSMRSEVAKDDISKPCEVVPTTYLVMRRKKVVKMALVMNFLLFITAIMCWLCQPSCCDNVNTMYLLPKLTYVNS